MANMLNVEDIVHVVADGQGVNTLYMSNRDVVRFDTGTGQILSVVKLPSAEEYEAAQSKGPAPRGYSQQHWNI